MSSNRAEEEMTFTYGCLLIFYAVSAICLGVPFFHWKATLEIQKDRGCILFAARKNQQIVGGGNSWCIVAFVIPLLLAMYSLCMGCYHFVGVCGIWMRSMVVSEEATSSSRNSPDIRKPPWNIFTFLAAIIIFINLVHVLFCTIGFYRTCHEYDDHVIEELNITGVHAEIMLRRVSCGEIYSFMDYIHKVPTVHRDRMYTGMCLMFGIVSSFAAALCWSFSSVVFCGQMKCCAAGNSDRGREIEIEK